MSRIPDSLVDDVRAASDLVDVVGERVRLKKQGRRYIGLCPFHNEKTPSFAVIADEQFYHCYGCKASGDVFKFVQETEGVGFLDAVRLLAERAGIALPEDGSGPEADRTGAMHAALRFAARYYVDVLRGDDGERGRAYLQERGFTKEAVVAFGIGLAPDAWDGLLAAATAEGFKPDVLEAVGLVKARERGEGHYDVFRDRLMFPILSPIGKVLGFGGRILPDTRQGSADYTPAKYINTPETEVYHKSRVLFGMKQAKRAIRAEAEAVVVEGYADVVALWQAGVQHVVAASGTALTAPQMELLRRLDVQRVLLLFDADAAGQEAARKAVDVALDAGIIPYAVTLPDGADPDSFVRLHGGESFRGHAARERRDFVEFLVELAGREGRLATPEGKADVARDVMRSVQRIDDPVLAEEYVRIASRVLGVEDVYLRRYLGRSAPPPRRPAPPPVEADAAAPPAPAPVAMRPEERLLLRLMLRQGTPMVEHVLSRMGLDEFSDGPPRQLAAALVAQYEAGAVDAAPFVRGEHGDGLQRLAVEVQAERHALSDNWGRRLGVSVPDLDATPFEAASSAMRYLKRDRVDEAIDAAKRRLLAAERAGEDVTAVNAEIVSLTDLRRQIESGAFLEG